MANDGPTLLQSSYLTSFIQKPEYAAGAHGEGMRP